MSQPMEQTTRELFFKAIHRLVQQLFLGSRLEAIDGRMFTLFCLKFHPETQNKPAYEALKTELYPLSPLIIEIIDCMLLTNFFLEEKKAVSFRLDPRFLQNNKEDFPIPAYGMFYIFHEDFFGFHIRFEDLARGGFRTVLSKEQKESHKVEPTILRECYQLAWTQQKKNKDIPEGGAKAILFVKDSMPLYVAQKAFIESLLTLINTPLNPHIINYLNSPEYIYLGPDENMHDSMIDWIAKYSVEVGYKPGIAFISGKTNIGINHKQYGVTSYGLTTCLDEALRFLGLYGKPFSVKMAGGPDGDVAGNQIVNLYKYYGKNAKLIALIDKSGVIYEPKGLDLAFLVELFRQSKPIHMYPKERLTLGGFLFDKETATLWKDGKKSVLEASQAHELFTTYIHRLDADIFIPAGGRPCTLNIHNIGDYLDKEGQPTSRAIIEGANLYLTPEARLFLEERSTLIIKDSTANKGGVICSSFEVLSLLVLREAEFIAHKEALIREILDRIKKCAEWEVLLILRTHKATKKPCSTLSDLVSIRIYEEVEHLHAKLRDRALNDEEMGYFFEYTLPLLRDEYRERLLKNIPEVHKKAIVATLLATKKIYSLALLNL